MKAVEMEGDGVADATREHAVDGLAVVLRRVAVDDVVLGSDSRSRAAVRDDEVGARVLSPIQVGDFAAKHGL